jgi:hypothetical protein
MNLQFLKTATCPDCGAAPSSESIDADPYNKGYRQHVNGMRWEHRQFICGSHITFVPNFQREERTRACPHNAKVKARRDNLNALLTRLKEQVGAEAGLDPEDSARIVRALDGCQIH